MSRYDYIRIKESLLPVNSFQRKDLSNLEFQTKSLDREFLEYDIDENGKLSYMDYEYELVDTGDSMFKFKLKRKNLTVKDSSYSGEVWFYGKPYDVMYMFKAVFNEGQMVSIERVVAL